MKRSIIMNKNHIVLIFPVTTFIAFIYCSMPFYSHIVHCCCYLMIQVFLYIIISITAYAHISCLWNTDLFFFLCFSTYFPSYANPMHCKFQQIHFSIDDISILSFFSFFLSLYVVGFNVIQSFSPIPFNSLVKKKQIDVASLPDHVAIDIDQPYQFRISFIFTSIPYQMAFTNFLYKLISNFVV